MHCQQANPLRPGDHMSSFVSAVSVGGALLAIITYFWWRGTANVLEAHRWVRDGALVIDVDSSGVFVTAHLDGAVNIPAKDIAHRQGEIGPIERPIVVYARSGLAAHVLRSIGYHSVLNLGPMTR